MAHEEGWTIQGSYGIVPTRTVKVGNQRQLLMDRFIVEDWCECRRVVHQPVRHLENPLISCSANEPQSADTRAWPTTREQGLFRLWVHSGTPRGCRPSSLRLKSQSAPTRSRRYL